MTGLRWQLKLPQTTQTNIFVSVIGLHVTWHPYWGSYVREGCRACSSGVHFNICDHDTRTTSVRVCDSITLIFLTGSCDIVSQVCGNQNRYFKAKTWYSPKTNHVCILSKPNSIMRVCPCLWAWQLRLQEQRGAAADHQLIFLCYVTLVSSPQCWDFSL